MFHKAIFRYPLSYSRSHRSFSHLYPCPRFLRTFFVIAMERSDRSNLLASSTLARNLSLRWSIVTEAIPLQATFVFGLLRYARNDKNQDGHVVFKKTPRHDNLLLDRRTAFAMTSCLYTCPRGSCARFLSLRTLKE
jgi:hypothetical protein